MLTSTNLIKITSFTCFSSLICCDMRGLKKSHHVSDARKPMSWHLVYDYLHVTRYGILQVSKNTINQWMGVWRDVISITFISDVTLLSFFFIDRVWLIFIKNNNNTDLISLQKIKKISIEYFGDHNQALLYLITMKWMNWKTTKGQTNEFPLGHVSCYPQINVVTS